MCVTSKRHHSVTRRRCKRLVYLERTSSGLDAWYVTVLLLLPALPSTSLSSLVTLSKRTLADSSVSVSSVTGVTLWHNASALTASWTRETTVRRTYQQKRFRADQIVLNIVRSHVLGHASSTAKRYTRDEHKMLRIIFSKPSKFFNCAARQAGKIWKILKDVSFGWNNHCSTG